MFTGRKSKIFTSILIISETISPQTSVLSTQSTETIELLVKRFGKDNMESWPGITFTVCLDIVCNKNKIVNTITLTP